MPPDDMDQAILDSVIKHYESTDSPYYLAELGNFFRLNNFQIPEEIRFKDFLESRFQGCLVVVQDSHTPAKIAIATPENEGSVRQRLANHTENHFDNGTTNYSRLPFSLVTAFCKVPPPNMDVFFRVTTPFRYEIHTRAPDDNYVLIDQEFRPPELAGKSLQILSSTETQEVYAQIVRWASANGIDLRRLYFNYATASPKGPNGSNTKTHNALQRLIDAQEPALKSRINIPGDIASKLMEIP